MIPTVYNLFPYTFFQNIYSQVYIFIITIYSIAVTVYTIQHMLNLSDRISNHSVTNVNKK